MSGHAFYSSHDYHDEFIFSSVQFPADELKKHSEDCDVSVGSLILSSLRMSSAS